MKNEDDIVSNDCGLLFSKPLKHEPNDHAYVNKKTDLDFNAAVGMFFVFSMVYLLFVIPIAALLSFSLKVNMLPIFFALMLTVSVVVTLFVLSHALNIFNVIKEINNWRKI